MKTKTASNNETKHYEMVEVASEKDGEKFRLWFGCHGRREFERWKQRNDYNKPPVDFNVVTGHPKMSG